MKFIDTLKYKAQERRVKRLEKDLNALRGKMKFDPRLLMLDKTMETQKAFTRRIYEYKVWSMGNAGSLAWFYRTGNANIGMFDYNKHNYFWASAPTKRRMVHCGIPSLISTRMSDILFKNGVKINAVVYKNTDGESLSEDKSAEKKLNEFISSTLVGKIKLQDNLQTSAVNESWGGHCFLRLSHDSSISAYPILEAFDITQCEVIKERKITKAIVFKNWYEYNNKSYRLDEIYSTTEEDGDGCITYNLFTFEGDKEKEVSLLSIPQTQEMFYVNGSGNEYGISLDEKQRFVYKGLKGMLAFEKPNKTPSQEFPNSDYGASDYEGAIDYFDSLDEITSANVREIRTNETKRYIPDTMLPTDENGNPLPMDEFCDSFVTVKGDPDQDATNKIETTQITDKTDSYLAKWKTVLSMICNKAKLSPYSLGITWLEAVGPSADSLRERNKVTIDMRKGKLALWIPLLQDLLLRSLQLTTWMQENVDGIKEKHKADGVPEIDITQGNTTIQLDFGEYVEDGVSQRITTWGGAKAQRVASTEECIRQIHPDWTESKVNNEVNLIRFEDGMSVDNPSNLPELTGEDEEETDLVN